MQKGTVILILVFIVLLGMSSFRFEIVAQPTLVSGLNYLCNGNYWDVSESMLHRDFSRFQSDGFVHLSCRIMWSGLEPHDYDDRCHLDSTDLSDLKTMLDIANQYGLKVNIDFWTQFGHTLGLPNWVSPNNYWTIVRDDYYLGRYRRYVKAVATELRDHPAVESYAIFNEPWFQNSGTQDQDREDFQTAFQLLVSDLHEVDPDALVTCRITLNHTPRSGSSYNYDSSIYGMFDIFSITEYLDPRDPSDDQYDTYWYYWDNLIEDLQALGKHLWIIEHGCQVEPNGNGPEWDTREGAGERVRLMIEKAIATGIVERYYLWEFQGSGTTTDDFNVFNTDPDYLTPDPAYYECAVYAGSAYVPPPDDDTSRPSEEPVEVPPYDWATPDEQVTIPELGMETGVFLCAVVLVVLYVQKKGGVKI